MQEFEGEARWGREEVLAVLVPHFENGIAVAAVEEGGIGEAREDDLRDGGLANHRGSGSTLPKQPNAHLGYTGESAPDTPHLRPYCALAST